MFDIIKIIVFSLHKIEKKYTLSKFQVIIILTRNIKEIRGKIV